MNTPTHTHLHAHANRRIHTHTHHRSSVQAKPTLFASAPQPPSHVAATTFCSSKKRANSKQSTSKIGGKGLQCKKVQECEVKFLECQCLLVNGGLRSREAHHCHRSAQTHFSRALPLNWEIVSGGTSGTGNFSRFCYAREGGITRFTK